MQENRGNVMFPIFLKLENLDVLVVGGGFVGEEKLAALLKHSPKTKIDVVSTFFREETQELIDKFPNVKQHTRKFSLSDLDNKDIVVLATDNASLHATIKAETRKRRILTNVADTPDLCDFYLGSIVKKGDLKIAISSNGKSPTLTKRIRQYLEAALPENTQELLDNLANIRDQLRNDFQYKVDQLNEITKSMVQKKNDDLDA